MLIPEHCLNCRKTTPHESTDDLAPLCPSCGGRLRPHIVWFGEALDEGLIAEILSHLKKADLLIVAGTSGVVYPAAGFARQVNAQGGEVIEINTDPVLPFAVQLKGKSGEILPALVS